jgi:hypothetical protein
LRFSNGLVPGGDLKADECANIRTSGGTELAKAIDQIEQLCGLPRKLLIVTDGEYGDDPREKLARIPEVREYSPRELQRLVAELQ